MSIRKNFRLDTYTNALLEEVSEHLKKSQTNVLEQFLMQRASEKIKNGY